MFVTAFFKHWLCVSAVDTEFSGLALSPEHCGRWYCC